MDSRFRYNTLLSLKINTGAKAIIFPFQVFLDPSLDHLLIMETKFQSKFAVFYVLHKASPLYRYYFMLLIMILHSGLKNSKN